MYIFSVLDWKKRKNQILKHIARNFNSSIIIRSSAIGEDSYTNSKAGNYVSVLNICPKNEQSVTKAIDNVTNSYSKKSEYNSNNQILIQVQTKNTITSKYKIRI